MPTQEPARLPAPIAQQFLRYASAGALGTGVRYVVLNAIALVLSHLGPRYLIAQIDATAAVLAAGYLANRAWTF